MLLPGPPKRTCSRLAPCAGASPRSANPWPVPPAKGCSQATLSCLSNQKEHELKCGNKFRITRKDSDKKTPSRQEISQQGFQAEREQAHQEAQQHRRLQEAAMRARIQHDLLRRSRVSRGSAREQPQEAPSPSLASRLIIPGRRNHREPAPSTANNYSFEQSRQLQPERQQHQRQQVRPLPRVLDPFEEFMGDQIAVLTRSGLSVRLIPELQSHIEQMECLKQLASRLNEGLLGSVTNFYRLRIFTLQSTILNNIVQIISARIDQQAREKALERKAVSGAELERIAPVEVARSGAEECPICMVEVARFQEIRTLPCRHAFHTDCIDQWIKKNPSCPKCRVDLKK